MWVNLQKKKKMLKERELDEMDFILLLEYKSVSDEAKKEVSRAQIRIRSIPFLYSINNRQFFMKEIQLHLVLERPPPVSVWRMD